MSNEIPKMFGIQVPVIADPVAAPIVTYGGEPCTSIQFLTADDGWGRVTFDNLDSIRVSRGEYDPYPSDWKPGDPIYWVSEVLPSPWLRERYEYEKKYYARAYEFGRDVDEMLRDFSHYVFSFHDQFVEAVAAGIWFETFDHQPGNEELRADHPVRDLSRPDKPDVFAAHGISYEIWPNTQPADKILVNAKLGSQRLMDFAMRFESFPKSDCTLTVRARHGKVHSTLAPRFGRELMTFEGVATFDIVRPHLENWIQEISERRKQM